MVMFALVYWTRSRTTSVVPKSDIPGSSNMEPDVGDIVVLPYGKKQYHAKILKFSEDSKWLDKLAVSADGKIIAVQAKKKTAKGKEKIKHLRASVSAVLEGELLQQHQEESCKNPSGTQKSNEQAADEFATQSFNTKKNENPKKIKAKSNDLEVSVPKPSEDNLITQNQEEEVEVCGNFNKGETFTEQRIDPAGTQSEKRRKKNPKKETKRSLHSREKVSECSEEELVDESREEVRRYSDGSETSSEIEARNGLGDAESLASALQGSSSATVSLKAIEPALQKLFEQWEANRTSGKSSKHAAKKSHQKLAKVQEELQEGSGVYVDRLELRSIKRWANKPNEMVRRLMLIVVGEEELKEMTARGMVTCTGKEGTKRKKLKGIPAHILDAVKHFIDTHGLFKLEKAEYHRVINQQCYSLRNPKKPSKTDDPQSSESN